jgi:hypothetical protein
MAEHIVPCFRQVHNQNDKVLDTGSQLYILATTSTMLHAFASSVIYRVSC